MGSKTALYAEHLRAGGKMVDFSGWDMPLHYGSQIEEHRRVRDAAGIFDVSHMTVIDLAGVRAEPLLRLLLANDVARLGEPGQALYTCLLNGHGGIIDDLIAYFRGSGDYRLVVNAGTRDKDLAWIRDHAADFEVEVRERADLAMLAVQGPEARARVHAWLPPSIARAVEALGRFHAAWEGELFVARTGYTGEDGYEIILPNGEAPALWRALIEAGVAPCGLGARDTLRLEAGMNLYGHDMDETTTPLESGLAWTVAWEPKERHFMGREVLEAQREAGPERVLVGLVLEGKGVLRDHQRVTLPDGRSGEVTSGSFAPTLQRSIALARIPTGAWERVEVDIRGRPHAARVMRPPFVRNGRSRIEPAAAG